MSDTFTCESCGGTFPKKYLDDHARVEMVTRMPEAVDLPMTEISVICGDCYEDFMRWFEALTPEERGNLVEQMNAKGPDA